MKFKRNEHHVKQALKKEKSLQVRRDAVKADMIDWLTRVHFAKIPQPLEALQRFIRDGWKGWSKLRSKALVREFEDEVVRLSGKGPHGFYKHTQSWDGTYKGSRSDHDVKTLQGFLAEANAIQSRLMEIAFKLDEE